MFRYGTQERGAAGAYCDAVQAVGLYGEDWTTLPKVKNPEPAEMWEL